MKRAIKLNPRDNVAVVTENVTAGDDVSTGDVTIKAISDIRLPHKIALIDFEPGDIVYKYGQVIGYATVAIALGEHVHNHNIDSMKLIKADLEKQEER